MAFLNNTRTPLAVTSPRSPEKMIPEISLLHQYLDGQVWNIKNQERFFHLLSQSGFYKGEKMPKDIAFAARDRITRAPKALGFVDLRPTIRITEAGRALIDGTRVHEVFTKQLLKFQLPSPYHITPKQSTFNIKPYLELLRFVHDLGKVTKQEIAMFFLQLIDHNDYNTVLKKVKDYRKRAKANKINRREFDYQIFSEEIKELYAAEIKGKKTKTRESADNSLKNFIDTKQRNHRDYADAFVRYLRATELVTFEKNTYHVMISPFRLEEVEYLLQTINPDALSFKDEAEFKDYLFSLDSIQLLTDDRKYLENKLAALGVKYSGKESISKLKDLLEKSEQDQLEAVIQETSEQLKNYQDFDDVINVYSQIAGKQVPDPSLFLEWNTWRAMVMLNDALTINGHFRVDFNGMPLSTAMGNTPDIQGEYDSFQLIVEVTMSSGNKQYEMEGEPVARHFGNLQKNSAKPVYCLFIAPKISEGSLAHFFNLNRMNTKFYGGKTRIIPMSLDQFISFITVAREKQFSNSETLKNYLDGMVKNNLKAQDEEAWYEFIGESIPTWVN
jgi:hypothetical protein